MTSSVTREASFLKKLFITLQGDASSAHVIDVDTGGIRFYNAPSGAHVLLDGS
jgi:hypothetical protein